MSKIYLSFIVLGSFLILLGGCSSSKIYHHRIPSEDALENISRFHIDRFEGEQSGFFREILIYEFNRLSYVDYLEEYPEGSDDLTAIVDAEVTVLSSREEEVLKQDMNYELVEHELVQEQSSGKTEARKAFEFRETPKESRWFQRTLDLEINFVFKSLATNEVVRDEFSRKGFRMFNESVMKEVYRAIEQEAIVDRPVDSLIAMALDQRAEIMVRMEMIGGKRDKKGGAFYAVKSTVRLGVYEASSGRQIADTVAEGKELSASKPGPYDWYKMLSKAGKRSGAEAARQAIVRIADFYQQSGEVGNAFLMVFRNYNFEDEDRILDYLENSPGFQQLTELKNTRGYLEIELFSSQQKSRLRRKIIRDLKDQEIELAVQSISGNRLVFINPNEMEEKPLPAAEKLESQ